MKIATILILLCGSAFAQANIKTIYERTGSAQSNRAFLLSVVFKEGDIQAYAQPKYKNALQAEYQNTVLTRWPGGSLKHALVDFKGSLTGSEAAQVAFENTPTPCHLGNQATCKAAGLDQIAELLDPPWLTGSPRWNSQIDTTGIAASINARTMLSTLALADNKIRFWRIGPIATEVIIEDKSTALSYDFGSDANKSLHPRFTILFVDGWQGVRTEFVVENNWHTKRQNQTYAVSLKNAINGGALAEVFSKASFTQYDTTRWHQTFWAGTNMDKDGSGNDKIFIDHNRLYWTASKFIPTYDPVMIPSAGAISSALAVYNATDKCPMISGIGQYTPVMGSGGGREEIGLTHTWEARYLMTMHDVTKGPSILQVVMGHAQCQGNVPIHIRESNPAKPSFGNWLDINDETPMTGAGCVGTCGGAPIQPDLAHFPAFGYIPWLITGELWYLEELQATASWVWTNLNESATLSYGRGGTLGIITQTPQLRGYAWGIRSIAQASFATPDAEVSTKAQYTALVNNNIAGYEGKLNITGSPFQGNAAWNFGHDVIAPNADSGHCTPPCGRLPNPLGFMMYDSSPAGLPADYGINSTNSFVDLAWKMGYVHEALGQVADFGFNTRFLHPVISRELINNTLNPIIANHYIQGGYMHPRINATGSAWWQNWTDYYNAYTAAQKAKTPWSAVAPSSHDGDCDNGYPHLFRGGAAFIVDYADGPYTGRATYDWLNANVGRGCQADNPKHAFVPRTSAITLKLVGSATSTQGVIAYTCPEDVCQIEASTSPALAPLLNDVNPSLFTGSNLDTRSIVNAGRVKQVVLGKRTVEYGLDGKRYSRALPADRVIYVRVTAPVSGSTGTTQFRTGTIKAGLTHAEPLPADSTRPGETAWPTIPYAGAASKVNTSGFTVTRVSGDSFAVADWNGMISEGKKLEYYVAETRYLIASVTDSNTLVLQTTAGTQTNAQGLFSARNLEFYDPKTGAEFRLFGIPRDERSAATPTSSFGSAAGTNWTSASNALALDGAFADYSGTTQDWLFLKAYRVKPATWPDFLNVVNLYAKTSTGTESIGVCITTDVDATGARVCESPIVNLTVTTTLTPYTVCKDAPCTVTRVPGDYLGIGADTIPGIRQTNSIGKITTNTGVSTISFSNAVDCNRLTTQDVTESGVSTSGVIINRTNFSITALNCGSLQATVSPTPTFTGSNWPMYYNTGLFSNPRAGILIRKNGATGSTISIDQVQHELGLSFTFGGTSGGMHSLCSPVLSPNGFARCVTNTGSGGTGPVFAIHPSTGEVRTLGKMAFFGQTYGFQSGLWDGYCQGFGFGQKLWDPDSADLTYCGISDASGDGVLVKTVMNGNDAHIPATEANPDPLVALSTVVNLTAAGSPGTVKQQIAAWDPTLEMARWNCGPDVVTKDGTDVFIIVVCRRGYPFGQDSLAFAAIFKLNPAKTTATLVALNKGWQNPASRGCLLHTTLNLGHYAPFANFGLQSPKTPLTGPGFGPWYSTLAANITSAGQTSIQVTSNWNNASDITPAFGGTLSSSGTTVNCSGTSMLYEVQPGHTITAGGQTRTIATVGGNTGAGCLTVTAAFSPDISGQSWTYRMGTPPAGYQVGDPLSTYPDRYIASMQVDDVYQIDSEYVRVSGPLSGGTVTVTRGVGWYDQATSTATTHTAGAPLRWLCSSGPSAEQTGLQNKFFDSIWDFKNSTNGASTTYYKGIWRVATGHGATVDYPAQNVGIQLNDNFGVFGRMTDLANWNRNPADFSFVQNPTFAGKIAPGTGNNYQGHLSLYCPLCTVPLIYSFFDVAPMIGGFSDQATTAMCQSCGSYTLTGDLWRYTYNNGGGSDADGLSVKQLDQLRTAGDRILRDISSPTSTITGGSGDAFKGCYAYRPNECLTGALAGEQFVNVPGLEPLRTYCSGGETFSSARDLCVADMTQRAQSVTQTMVPPLTPQAATFVDSTARSVRVLGTMFNYWRKTTNTCNVKLTPGGEYLLHGCGGHEKGAFLIKVPPFVKDTTTRSTYSPLAIGISAVPSGTSRVMIQYWHDEYAGYCKDRAENCYAVGSALDENTPFLWEHELTASSGVPCSTNCTVTIPVISGRQVYYKRLYRDAAGVTIRSGPTETFSVD